jgi:hypothetical protein
MPTTRPDGNAVHHNGIAGMFISNTATAVLMAPIALAIAGDLQAPPYPFARIVALAASSAFMTLISSPVNTLVVGPGNYTFEIRTGWGAIHNCRPDSQRLAQPWLLPRISPACALVPST